MQPGRGHEKQKEIVNFTLLREDLEASSAEAIAVRHPQRNAKWNAQRLLKYDAKWRHDANDGEADRNEYCANILDLDTKTHAS